MNTRFLRLLFAAVASLLGTLPTRAAPDDNWPDMRGPQFTGASTTATPPTTWSETANLKWKVKIPGAGTSTPVIWDDRVFILTAVDPKAPANPAPVRGGGLTSPAPTTPLQFILQCIDRQSGKTLWQQIATEQIPHEGKHPDGTYAAASPVTDGSHVWAFFGSRGLYCYDMDGKLLWSQDLGKMKILMGFGEGASPALCGDKIIVNWDDEANSFIIALDKLTGKTLWKTPRDEKSSWATPLVVDFQGQTQIVSAASAKVRSYDPATGKQLWETAGLTKNVIPCPVTADGIVYCTSGYSGTALLAIQLGKTGTLGALAEYTIAWRYNKNTPYVPSPLLYQGRLYFFSSNNAVLTCLDAKTGKPLIDAAKIDALSGVYASPVAADGRIYLVGRNGATVVLKAADTLQILATNKLDESFTASPALAGKELFLRGKDYLYNLTQK